MCCAGSRLLVQESIYEPLVEKLKRRLTTLRVGDPLDKNTDVGAINSKMQLDKIKELVEAGKEEGAEIYQPPCRLPEKGYWFVPTVFTNVAQSYRIAQEEIFGPVLSVLTFRTPDEAVEKANNTPYGLSAGVWTEKGSRILWMAQQLRAGVVWANTYNRFDPSVAVRRLQGVRLRPRGRPARARAVPEVRLGERRMSRLPVKKTYKLFIGGAFPRSESGRTYEAEGQNVARASRKDVRDAVRVARGAFAKWAGMTAYNRGQVLYRVAEMIEARAVRVRGALAPARRRSTARSTAFVWYAGWADKLAQVLGGSNPVAGPVLQLHRAGADRRRRRARPGRAAARSGSSRASRPRSWAGTRSSRSPPRRTRSRRSSSPRCSRPPTCPAASSTSSPASSPSSPRGSPAHMDVNAIDVTGADGLVAELERLAAENVKRVVHGQPDGQSPWEIADFLELKTVWHPIGR